MIAVFTGTVKVESHPFGYMLRPLTIGAFFAAIPFAAAATPAETPIEARSPAGVLKGTMLAPGGRKCPVVLIIPGSGLAGSLSSGGKPIDPAKLIATYRNPVLILQGERDIQVSVSGAKRLKRAAPAARLMLLPDTNHVLKTVTSADWAANAAAYSDPSLPLAPGIIDGIADFIRDAPQARR